MRWTPLKTEETQMEGTKGFFVEPSRGQTASREAVSAPDISPPYVYSGNYMAISEPIPG